MFHPNILAFGTHQDVLPDREAWIAQQWDNVWPKTTDFRFDLDGAAAKQGRAFDGSAELFYRADDRSSGISGGIRILEGGADNSKVNTFALLDYAFLAITVGFGN